MHRIEIVKMEFVGSGRHRRLDYGQEVLHTHYMDLWPSRVLHGATPDTLTQLDVSGDVQHLLANRHDVIAKACLDASGWTPPTQGMWGMRIR